MSRGLGARRTVLWGVAVIVTAHLSFAVALETKLPQLRDPQYGYRLVRLREQQRLHSDRPIVLALGTSRTQNAIDPIAMDFPNEAGSPLVFNFGQAGASPVHTRLNLQRLRADGAKPAAVLVEVFPPSLALPDTADRLFEPHATRLTEADTSRLEPYLAGSAGLRLRWGVARANSLYGQRRVLASHVAPVSLLGTEYRLDHQWRFTDGFGFTAYPADRANEFRAEKLEQARAVHATALRDLRVSTLSVRAYRDLVTDCRAAGVQVAFYLLPESPTFRGWYSPASHTVLADFIHALRAEAGCAVFTAPDNFGEDDFADGHHMLKPAAARYSRWLADTHLRPWLANARKEAGP